MVAGVPLRPLGLAVFLAFGASAHAQRVRVEPRFARPDSVVSISITGLQADQPTTLRATRRDAAGQVWVSEAQLRADADGVARVRPGDMTLLTDMEIEGTNRGRARFQYAWQDTLRTVIQAMSGSTVLATDTVIQSFVTAHTLVRPVRVEGLVGTLFTPATAGASPGILVLGGSEGGLSSEDVAALLAEHGYAALALAYFGADSLAASLDRIQVEYFSHAIRWLTRQPGVREGRVGAVATSKGAEAALLLGSLDTAVAAIVAYAPSSVVWSCICSAPHSSWSTDGVDVAFVPAGADPDYRNVPGVPMRPAVNYRYRLRDSTAHPAARIPVERVRGPLLLIAGGDDGLWPSAEMAREILQRRKLAGVASRDVLLEYRDAGHLIGKAFLPAGSTVVGGGRLDTGGTSAANARAQADAWPRVLLFLRAVLGR